MEMEPFSFKDYVWRGLDAFVRFCSTARDSLLVESNRAIEKLDSWQIEKKLNRLYARLGQLSYDRLVKNLDVFSAAEEVVSLVGEITIVESELALKKSMHKIDTNDTK